MWTSSAELRRSYERHCRRTGKYELVAEAQERAPARQLLTVESDRPLAELVRDPVCHRLLDPSRATEHLSVERTEYCFCSTDCREAFEADPSAFA
jgi:YHS domain-containing protein